MDRLFIIDFPVVEYQTDLMGLTAGENADQIGRIAAIRRRRGSGLYKAGYGALIDFLSFLAIINYHFRAGRIAPCAAGLFATLNFQSARFRGSRRYQGLNGPLRKLLKWPAGSDRGSRGFSKRH